MMTGSCLCGTVRWRLDGPVTGTTHCHCSMCRKAHGAPFGTYGRGRAADFRFESGTDAIVPYESSPGFLRDFCGRCGSVVPNADDDAAEMIIPVGGVDDEGADIHVEAHIFAGSVAPWWRIEDDLPRHETWPEGDSGPVVDRPAPLPPADGVLHGSCLCGDIAYEVRSPVKRVFNCYCSRCRKARAAPLTTNGFTDMDGVVFTRGEESIRSFKVPDAMHFTQAFCPRCGGAVPRKDPGRGITVIPFGSLDDDPGRGADCHIWVAFKAPWYEIGGDLPRHEGAPPPA